MSLKILSQKLQASLEQRASQEEKSTGVTGEATPAAESASAESFLGLGRTMDEKIEHARKKLSEAEAELKRMEGEFVKEGHSKDTKWLDEHRSDVEKLRRKVEELEALKKADAVKASQEAAAPVTEAAPAAEVPNDVTPARETASTESIEPKAAESQAAVDAAPVVDEATVAAPEGGEKVVDVALHEEPEESAEDALNGASDASDLVDDAMRESRDLNRDVANLESVIREVREYPGGLSRADAEYARAAIEAITGDWELGVSICPSVESFGEPGTSASINATASLEANLVEVRNKIIAYVKEMFQKFAQFLVRFYQYITNSSKQLAMRGVKLSQAVQALGATAPRKGALDIGSLAGRVTADGRLAAPDAIMRTVEQQFGYAVVLDTTVQGIEAAAAAQAQRIRQATPENFDQVLSEAQAEYLKATVPPQFFIKDQDGGLRTMIFPGEKFYVAVDKDGHWRYESQKSGKTPTATAINTPTVDKLKALGNEAAQFGTKAGAKLDALSRAVINDKGQRFLTVLEGQASQLTEEQNVKLGQFLQAAAEDVKAVHGLAKDILLDAVKAAIAVIRIGEMSVALYQPKGVGEKVGEAAAAAGEKAGEAANAVKEGAGKAAAAVKEGAGKAADAVKNAAASVTGKGAGEPTAA